MNPRMHTDTASPLSLELFQPKSNVLYSLDAAAHLAAVPRRSLLIYWRAGLIRPVLQPPNKLITFTEEAICKVRRIEYLRTVHGLDVTWIKTLFDLLEEVERLRAEVRFMRERG